MINQNIDTLIYNYVSHCRFKKGLNPKTLKAYQTDLTQFAQFIKGNDGGCNKENLQAYIALEFRAIPANRGTPCRNSSIL